MSSSPAAFSLDQISPPPSEKLCYVHCNFCDTVLAVSVPYTSLFKTVTVRCGHCTNLLSVNMRGLLLPSTNQLHLGHPFQSPVQHNLLEEVLSNPPPNLMMDNQACLSNNFTSPLTKVTEEELPHNPIINRRWNKILAAKGVEMEDGKHASIIPPKALEKTISSCPLVCSTKGNQLCKLEATHPIPNSAPEKRQRVPSAYNRFIKDEIQRIKAGNPDITHREAFSAAAKNWAHFPHIHFGLMPDQTLKKTSVHPPEGDGFFAAAAANMEVAPF